MNDIDIGARLGAAASLIENGLTVRDIGCDHGKLGRYLLESGKAKRIIATDINEKPLQKAVRLFEERGLSDKALFYQTDGLQGVEDDGSLTHAVIAGVGGNTAAKIISDSDIFRKKGLRLILIPAQKEEELRLYLLEGGYEITRERAVEENGKFYTCILATYTGEKQEHDMFDLFIGHVADEDSVNDATAGYLRKRAGQLENILKGAKDETRTEYEKAYSRAKLLADYLDGGESTK
ncbi:MAG: SAM-dependent methyltransferase [Oscillospiraceae bacterium]|nr:SAM-dependent methyltransferase [Oscillospiraceae bacterium]